MSIPTIPPHAWDSHMHVTDPSRFPLDPSAQYTPHAATLPSALKNASSLALPNLVFVQPSPYGTDNSCLLDALQQVGPLHGRGVVVFDPHVTSTETLREWHKLGVRGVRINLKSVGKSMEKEELTGLLRKYEEKIRGFGSWVIQLYVDLKVVPALAEIISAGDFTSVKIVVDHIGQPPSVTSTTDMHSLTGWTELIQLFRTQSNFYIKISAPYRLTKDPTYETLEPAVKQLLEVAKSERGCGGLVFASDWPHTRFEGVDVRPWVQRCLEWCEGDEELVEALFRGNAERLWDVEWSK